MELISQTMIFVCTATSIWLLGRKESWSRLGFIVGLAGQPFWLYSSFVSEQWGIFALSLFFVYLWSVGIYNNYFSEKEIS